MEAEEVGINSQSHAVTVLASHEEFFFLLMYGKVTYGLKVQVKLMAVSCC